MPGEYSQAALEAHFNGINERLKRLEDQVERISKIEGIPYEHPLAEVPEDVVQLAQAGKKLEAAKRYRELTNAHLDQAMKVVSQL